MNDINNVKSFMSFTSTDLESGGRGVLGKMYLAKSAKMFWLSILVGGSR